MSFLGTIARGLGGAAKGFLSGGPIGAVKGGISAAFSRPGTAIAPVITPPIFTSGGGGVPSLPSLGGGGMAFIGGGKQGPNVSPRFPGAVPEPGFKGGLQRFLPGGESGFTGAPPGFHVNKSYLRYLRAEATGRMVQNPFNEQRAKNVIVRNRSMNPLNPRALRRANARQVAAVRLMRRTMKGSGYTITRSRFGAKKKRR